MATIFDVPPNDLITEVAAKLKDVSEVEPPVWATYVKTGMHKQRPPTQDDWWYLRCAAIMRTCARLGPVGVSKLRTKYGGKKNRGHKPERSCRGSGNIIRKALQQLEAAKLLKQMQVDKRKGRIVTSKGQALLDACAKEAFKKMARPQGRPVPKPAAPPQAPRQEQKGAAATQTKAEKRPAAKTSSEE